MAIGDLYSAETKTDHGRAVTTEIMDPPSYKCGKTMEGYVPYKEKSHILCLGIPP